MLSHRPPATVPLSLPATGPALKSLVLEGDRAVTAEVRRLRPMATADGGMSAALADLQRALAPQAEAALLRRLDRPGKPPEPVLDQLWDWASPDQGGRTQLDSLARDRCALACSLWLASGASLLRALARGDGAVVQVLRELHRQALDGTRDATVGYPDACAIDARLEETEAWLQTAHAPARSRLGALLLAWSAPAKVGTPAMMRAFAEADAVAKVHAPDEDDVWLATLRCFLATAGRPAAAALLRQVAPVFLQAASELGTDLSAAGGDTANGLMQRLDELARLPEDEARALARDARRLPWSTDPPRVRVHCILACQQLAGAARPGAMDLVCARAPRLALQKAAGSAGTASVDEMQQLATLRRATLYGAFSVRLGQLAAGDVTPATENPVLDRLQTAEVRDLAPGPPLRGELDRLAAKCTTPERTAGVRVLNVWLATQQQLAGVSTMAVLAACARAEPIDGCTMVALLDACGQVALSGRGAQHVHKLRATVVLRLLTAPMPSNVYRLGAVVRGLLGEHVCREHAPPSYASAATCVELLDAALERPATDAQRTTLCLAVGEAIYGLSCRLEAVLVATGVVGLEADTWAPLLLRLLEDGDFATFATPARLRVIGEVAETCVAEAAARGEPAAATRAQAPETGWQSARRALGQAVEAAYAADAAASSVGAGDVHERASLRNAAHALALLRKAAGIAGGAVSQARPVALAESQKQRASKPPAPPIHALSSAPGAPRVSSLAPWDDELDRKGKAARRTSAPGAGAFVWHLGAAESWDDALPDASAGGPKARLRLALQRQLGAADVDALCLALEDCAVRLQSWVATLGHSGADHALQHGELDVLEAAAVTLEKWRTRRAPRRVATGALRLGAALVYRTLGPPPMGPYWATEDGRRRHYRALFAVMAGVRGSNVAKRTQLQQSLARQHLVARRGAAFGFSEA